MFTRGNHANRTGSRRTIDDAVAESSLIDRDFDKSEIDPAELWVSLGIREERKAAE
jgi:hypothetical protein